MELNSEMRFSYAVGFIHLLDFVARTQGGDPNQALMKKVWLTQQAAKLFLPNHKPEEIKEIYE